MPTEKSVKEVAELKKTFEESGLVIAAEYRGLKMAQLTALRAALKPTKTRFRVVKNTLAGIAADQAGRPLIRDIMKGPVGIITTDSDPVVVAKALTGYVQTSRLELKLVGGVLGSQALTPARISDLAKLPLKAELVAKLLGQMNAPIAGLVTVLNGPVRGLAVALQRIVEQKAQATGPAPSANGADKPGSKEASASGTAQPASAAAGPAPTSA